jgi:hypothetical protein
MPAKLRLKIMDMIGNLPCQFEKSACDDSIQKNHKPFKTCWRLASYSDGEIKFLSRKSIRLFNRCSTDDSIGGCNCAGIIEPDSGGALDPFCWALWSVGHGRYGVSKVSMMRTTTSPQSVQKPCKRMLPSSVTPVKSEMRLDVRQLPHQTLSKMRSCAAGGMPSQRGFAAGVNGLGVMALVHRAGADAQHYLLFLTLNSETNRVPGELLTKDSIQPSKSRK